jgi:hypothetical protein
MIFNGSADVSVNPEICLVGQTEHGRLTERFIGLVLYISELHTLGIWAQEEVHQFVP